MSEHGLPARGVLVAWELPAEGPAAAPGGPGASAVLVCEGAPAACCFGAGAACSGVVVAATEVGALCAWDLGESPRPCDTVQIGGAAHAARRPSFTTEAAALRQDQQLDAAHHSTLEPPVAISAVAAGGSSAGSSSSCTMGLGRRSGVNGGSCSLVVLGARGHVSVWTLRLLAVSQAGVAEADLGVRPGSRLLLVRTHVCAPLGLSPFAKRPRRLPTVNGDDHAARYPAAAIGATCLSLVPGDAQQLLVGCVDGTVLRGARIGEPPPPRVYTATEGRLPLAALCLNPTAAACSLSGSPVTSLAVSPFSPEVFLSAHFDGSIALHALDRPAAVRVWPAAAAVPLVAVRWSPRRACVAMALDSAGRVLCFDFFASLKAPVASLQLQRPPAVNRTAGKSSTAACVSFEFAPVGCWFVVAFADGSAQWHKLPQWLSEPQAGDGAALSSLLLA